MPLIVIDIGNEHEVINPGEECNAELPTDVQEDFIDFESDEYEDAIGINGANGGSDSIGNELSSDVTENEPNVRRSDRIASKLRRRYTKCGGEQGDPETFGEAVPSSNAG